MAEQGCILGGTVTEQRITASLILLFGLTMLALGLHFGGLQVILDLVKQVFKPAIAGLP